MKNPVGRPRKPVAEIRVSKGFSLSKDNLNFIAGISRKQGKSASEVLNLLLDNMRILRGE